MHSEIKYSITETDYLEFQLYTSSLLPSHQKQRARLRWLPVFTGGLIGIFAILRSEPVMAACLFFYCALWILFCHRYTRWRYTKHFKNTIAKLPSSVLSTVASISITDNALHSSSLSSGSPIALSAISSITEIKNLYLVSLETSETLILPKSGISSGDLDEFIQSLSEKTKLPLINDENRKWK